MIESDLEEKYLKRVRQLLRKLREIPRAFAREPLHDLEEVDREIVEECFQGTLGVIGVLYGSNSPQIKAVFEGKKASKQYSGVQYLANILRGTLANLEQELKAGLIQSIVIQTSGQIIGDFTLLAKAELKAGYKDVAAVLASAAFEDAIKQKAEQVGLKVGEKSLQTVLNALKAKGSLKGAQVPIASGYVKLRNAAMHGNWGKIQKADVNSLIGFLEPFLAEHFR